MEHETQKERTPDPAGAKERNRVLEQKEQEKTVPDPLEDAALKDAMVYFGELLLPQFGIKEKVTAMLPTEEIILELQRLYEDFNYVTENETILHFEFQSTNEGVAGLKRFRVYEAATSRKHKKPVITYVLYSGKIKNPMTEFQEGVNTYRIIPIIMSNKNADEVLQKIQNKEKITKEDLVSLLLTPLMSGTITVSERIKTSFRILREEEEKLDKDETQKMETVLYALASKLLDQQELIEVKEALRMTELGKMLKAEGIAEGKAKGIVEGKAKGKAEGKAEAVLLLLAELGPVPENLKKKIESQKDVKVLENWLKLAAKSKSVEDFVINK